jgi:hypothetical protein
MPLNSRFKPKKDWNTRSAIITECLGKLSSLTARNTTSSTFSTPSGTPSKAAIWLAKLPVSSVVVLPELLSAPRPLPAPRRVRVRTHSLAKTPLKAAHAPLARAKKIH